MVRKKFVYIILLLMLVLTGCSYYGGKNIKTSNNSNSVEGSIILQFESNHFKFYSKEQDKGCLKDLSNALENNYERITNDLNTSLNKKIYVYIYSDLSTYHEAINRPDAPNWVVGSAEPPNVIYMVNPSKESELSYSDFMKVIVHEFTHIVAYNITQA